MNPMLTLGAASWTELMTTDLDAAIAFYKAVFGWKVEVAPMSAGPYGVGQVDGKYISGMMSLPQEGMPPYWGVYFTVADVEATVAKATELGGTVIMDTFDAPEVGTMAVLQDPQQAVFSVIAYKEPDHEDHQRPWAENFGLNGAISWYELRVPDAAVAASFYQNLLGWTRDEQQMSMGPYLVFQLEGEGQGGILSVNPEEMPPTGDATLPYTIWMPAIRQSRTMAAQLWRSP
jgi:predicted enzyme related to lactoylglutathione lyase